MDSQRARPGFDHHASFIAHARYTDPVFIVDGKDTPTKGWIDDLILAKPERSAPPKPRRTCG